MRAAVISAPGRIDLEDHFPDPTPGPREVIVEVAAVGICGTDLHILAGGFAPSLPVIPGHEFAGTVVAVGKDVRHLQIGDRVTADPNMPCNECRYCRIGRGNLCTEWAAIGVSAPGAMAEYTAVPAANCVVLPDHVRTEDAALIEPLSCAVRGYDVLRARLASHILIYGAGTMGLMMLQLAKATGAATVDVIDINPNRLSTAVLLGCTNAAASAEEFPRRNWDIVIDATGNAQAIQDGLGRVAKSGTFLQFGVAEENAHVTINPHRIYHQEITITGSMAVLHSFERAADLFATGVLPADVLISHRVPLAQTANAFTQFQSGSGRKIQVLPNLIQKA